MLGNCLWVLSIWILLIVRDGNPAGLSLGAY